MASWAAIHDPYDWRPFNENASNEDNIDDLVLVSTEAVVGSAIAITVTGATVSWIKQKKKLQHELPRTSAMLLVAPTVANSAWQNATKIIMIIITEGCSLTRNDRNDYYCKIVCCTCCVPAVPTVSVAVPVQGKSEYIPTAQR